MADIQPEWNRDNRDLLVRLMTQVDALRVDVKELRDNTAARLTTVEGSKLDRLEASRLQEESNRVHADFEKRIRFIERYMWLAIGGITIINVVLNYVDPSIRVGV